MGFGMLANILTDLDNWIRSWDSTTFAIIVIVFISLMAMYGTNFLKGIIGSKFKFLSFLFLVISTIILVYICIKH